MDASKENRNTFISRGMSSLICLTSEHGTCFLNQIKTKQAPLPFTLVQMLLLICLLFSLTVFAAPVRTKQQKKGITVQISYFETSSVFLTSSHVTEPVLSSFPTTAHDTTFQRSNRLLKLLLVASAKHQGKHRPLYLHLTFKQRKPEFQLPSLQMYICNAVQNGC